MDDLLIQLKQEHFCPGVGLEDCVQLRSYQIPDLLKESEKQQIQGFFSGLGQMTTEQSIQEGLYYQKSCAQLLENARKEASTAEGLYTKLGLCCGALLALLLL